MLLCGFNLSPYKMLKYEIILKVQLTETSFVILMRSSDLECEYFIVNLVWNKTV